MHTNPTAPLSLHPRAFRRPSPALASRRSLRQRGLGQQCPAVSAGIIITASPNDDVVYAVANNPVSKFYSKERARMLNLIRNEDWSGLVETCEEMLSESCCSTDDVMSTDEELVRKGMLEWAMHQLDQWHQCMLNPEQCHQQCTLDPEHYYCQESTGCTLWESRYEEFAAKPFSIGPLSTAATEENSFAVADMKMIIDHDPTLRWNRWVGTSSEKPFKALAENVAESAQRADDVAMPCDRWERWSRGV